MRRIYRHFGIILAIAAANGVAWGDDRLVEARKLYNSTEFERSIKVLQAISPKIPAVWELMGRDYYSQAEYKKASEVLEKALALEPGNSEYALWLGRAYGRRAETSTPFTAPFHAAKACQYLEKSTQLNPVNLDALSDLFEYYLEAPGFLGGGAEKAEAIAARMAQIDPVEGHWAEAKLAEKRKESASAEAHLRRAIELGPHQIGKLIELARLLVKQGRYQEAEQNFDRAEKIAPNSPQLMFERAEIYIKAHHNVGVAKELLKQYMNQPIGPDDAPKSEAAKLLRQAQGD